MVASISNEILIGGISDQLVTNHHELNKLAKELDPTRLTTIAHVTMTPTNGPMHGITDVENYNHYFGWYGGRMENNGPWLDKYHAEHPDICLDLSEYGCEGVITYHGPNKTLYLLGQGVDEVKQDIMLICFQTEGLNKLQNVLVQSEMIVMQSEGIQNAIASMAQHMPAFLLLDFDMDDAASFLQEVSSSIFFRPPPYILIAATFAQGPDRATVLDLGADACIEKPIDPAEVVALIHAVLRREHKIVRLDTDTLTTELMVSVSAALAQEESVSISKNQRISYQRRMERGEFITCYAPLGYRLVDGKNLEIVEEEAELVRWIFAQYLAGRNSIEITSELSQQDLKTAWGKNFWCEKTVRKILTNETLS